MNIRHHLALVTILSASSLQAAPSPFATLDFLYWKANENGLGYALQRDKIHEPHFEWDEGFRVGLGSLLEHDQWDIALSWTRFHTFARETTQADEGIFPLWLTPTAGPANSIPKAEEHWRLHLGLVDLELARDFSISCALQLKPHLGLRYGCIRQKYHLLYTESLDSLALSMKNKYWGIGPRAGLDTNWQLGRGFSLYGKGGVSLLFGSFYIHQAEKAHPGNEKLLGVHNNFSLSRPIVDLSLGLGWERSFKEGCYHLEIQGGWEELFFFGQNQFLHFTSASAPGIFFSNQGDLTIQGLTLHTRFIF